MQRENGIKICIALRRTTTAKKIAFLHFFTSHLHCATIPGVQYPCLQLGVLPFWEKFDSVGKFLLDK
jgi:hypothetical protein